jgi:hypothetical protein
MKSHFFRLFLLLAIFPPIGWLARRSKPRGHNLGNLMRLRLATVARAPSPARSMSNEGGRQIRRKALYGTVTASRRLGLLPTFTRATSRRVPVSMMEESSLPLLLTAP